MQLYTSNITNTLTGTIVNNINHFKVLPLKYVYIVKDIPSYLNIQLNMNTSLLQTTTINQYKGYLINLINYNSTEDYIKEKLSKRNRKNLFSKQRKLEQNHKISNKVYFGSIDKLLFDSIFDTFYSLLQKRFQEKRIYNRHLADWEAIKSLSYKKILEQKASLHVIYDDHKPITITLNFHQPNSVLSHIQAYDTDYSVYNMGDISMLNHLKWCFANNILIFDLAIGKSDYKDKWCNYEYDFSYQIHYNNKSLVSKFIAKTIYFEFKILKFLREKNIVGNMVNFDKLLYKIKKC
ncbi:GNAT family N-acetyltransferase [Tamlana sp. 2201CG12-4]|uniref:GNAT family N-acetyltransferase n=1 Tax=Tamlana sp. 2201CG12-4 TaxID=3112582 RepID=UPI002DBDA6B9|nr:GNAT family N-acetyltransferase [Tamlana sp. 2201CG12-4]MEC3908031.1 GNAT family N-acetyltransferase [Tamlana sp. 2201CG12-4]